MTQIATVRKLGAADMVELQVRRQTACGHDCDECAGCTQVITGETVVWVKNDLSAGLGDVVMIESRSSQVLAAAAIVYLLPFLLFFIGYFTIGGLLSPSLAIYGGLAGAVLGLCFAIFWDRRERRKRNMQFKMVEIKKRCSAT